MSRYIHTKKDAAHRHTHYCCKLKYCQKCSYIYLYTTLYERKKNNSMLLCVKWQLYETMQQFYWVCRIFKLFVCGCSYGSFICSANGSISKYCSLFSNIFFSLFSFPGLPHTLTSFNGWNSYFNFLKLIPVDEAEMML